MQINIPTPIKCFAMPVITYKNRDGYLRYIEGDGYYDRNNEAMPSI